METPSHLRQVSCSRCYERRLPSEVDYRPVLCLTHRDGHKHSHSELLPFCRAGCDELPDEAYEVHG